MKKTNKPIKRIALVANPEKRACRAAVQQAVQVFAEAKRELMTDPTTAQCADLKDIRIEDVPALARRADFMCVFGGDGTMLRAARETAGSGCPIFGINMGGLGFLTATPARQMVQALHAVLRGEYVVDRRPLIEARRGEAAAWRQKALNDFVIGRTTVTRLIELEVGVDGAVVSRYRCDGLIISSPTGSTAYSLAAGGAVVTPNAEVYALTPICPHTLSNRSLIVSLSSEIQVRVLSTKVETILSADGQVQTHLSGGDHIIVRRSKDDVPLVRLRGSSFFDTLRQKLKWRGSNV